MADTIPTSTTFRVCTHPRGSEEQPVLWIPVFLIVLLERHNWLFLQFECSFFLQSVPTSFGELCNYPYTSVTLAGGARASKCISTYCHPPSLLKMIVGVCPFVLWGFLFICFCVFLLLFISGAHLCHCSVFLIFKVSDWERKAERSAVYIWFQVRPRTLHCKSTTKPCP